MAKNILLNVLLDKASVDLEMLNVRLALSRKNLELGKRDFSLGGKVYVIDHTIIAENAAILGDKLLKNGKLIAADVVSLKMTFLANNRPQDDIGEDEESSPSVLYPLYASELFHRSNDWPVDGVMNGVVVLQGGTGSGKTTRIKDVLNADVIIRYGEPSEMIDLDPRAVPARSVSALMTMMLTLSTLGMRVAVDSLRSLLYGLKGNTTTLGISAGVYDFLTQANNAMADIGGVAVMALNPLTGEGASSEDVVQTVFSRLTSACSGGQLLGQKGEMLRSTYRLTTGRSFESSSPDTSRSPELQRGRVNDSLFAERVEQSGMMFSLERLNDDPSLRARTPFLRDAAVYDDAPNSPASPRATAPFTL